MPRGLAVHGVFVAISAFTLLRPPGASAAPEGSTEPNNGFSGGGLLSRWADRILRRASWSSPSHWGVTPKPLPVDSGRTTCLRSCLSEPELRRRLLKRVQNPDVLKAPCALKVFRQQVSSA